WGTCERAWRCRRHRSRDSRHMASTRLRANASPAPFVGPMRRATATLLADNTRPTNAAQLASPAPFADPMRRATPALLADAAPLAAAAHLTSATRFTSARGLPYRRRDTRPQLRWCLERNARGSQLPAQRLQTSEFRGTSCAFRKMSLTGQRVGRVKLTVQQAM